MIDFIVLIQAAVAGAIFWCAKYERGSDRLAFSLLAATAGLMTVRRVTAQYDALVTADRVVLPAIITFVFASSAAFFVIERLRRMDKDSGRPLWKRVLWPSSLPAASFCFAVAVLCDFLPASSAWDGRHMAVLTWEDALREMRSGKNQKLAAEKVRWEIARATEEMAVLVALGGPDVHYYKNKLRAIRDAADKEFNR